MIKAVIYIERNDIRYAVREELKRLGFQSEQIYSAQSHKEALKMVEESKDRLIVLDWDIGSDLALEILEANLSNGKLDSNPIFLLSSVKEAEILAAAREFFVSQVHLGEISVDDLVRCISYLVKELREVGPLKADFARIAKAKAFEDFSFAAEILQSLHEKDPNNTRIATALADCWIDIGYGDAEIGVVLKRACSSEPAHPRALQVSAKYYLKKGDHGSAIKCLENACLLNPYNVDRLLTLGQIFLEKGRLNDAKQTFQNILDFAPYNCKAKLKKGESMLRLGEMNEALLLLRDVASAREKASVFNNAAIIQVKNRNYKQAMLLYRTAKKFVIKNKKISSLIWYNMGIGFIKWKRIEKSRECFAKSRKLNPGFKYASHNFELVDNYLSGSAQVFDDEPSKGERVDLASRPEIPELHIGDSNLGGNVDTLDHSLLSADFSDNFSALGFDSEFDDDV